MTVFVHTRTASVVRFVAPGVVDLVGTQPLSPGSAHVQRAFEAIAAGDPSTLQVLLDFTEETM